MHATEIKEIANQANEVDEDRIDADLKHIEIEIYEAAKKGSYSLDYEFLPLKNFGELNEFKNRLLNNGYKVELNDNTLSIDWS